jgi:hypothetical protein
MREFKTIFFTSFLLLSAYTMSAQLRVELKNRIKYPEVYFWKHLHDTILVANEGYNFSNFASVRFEIDRKGEIQNIVFSTYTDSLVMPHITNVLMSTNRRWLIVRNGKYVKEKVTILLPILFILKSERKNPITVKEDILSLHPTMSIEEQMFRIFHFSNNRDENFEVHKRNGEKFEGIALNPIEVIVPLNPTIDKY